MALKIFKNIKSVDDLRERFPKTFTYFLSKCPTSIITCSGYVSLTNNKNGISLTYDFFDIEHFEKTLP